MLYLQDIYTQNGKLWTFVDLHGEIAQIFGASAKQYRGAVWKFTIDEDTWDEIRQELGTPGIEQWREFIIGRKESMVWTNWSWLRPLAPSVLDFFSIWAEDSHFPPYRQVAFEIPEMKTFIATIDQLRSEKERAEQMEKMCTSLQKIFAFLDKGGKAYLTSCDLKPLWEVGGWLTNDSEADDLYASLIALCNQKGFDTSDGIPCPAFSECFVLMPLPPPETTTWCEKIDDYWLKEYLTTLRVGPHFNGHYLGDVRADEIANEAVVHDMFQMLDVNGDGNLSFLELKPFLELLGGYLVDWEDIPPTPLHAAYTANTEGEWDEKWRRLFEEICEAKVVPMDTGPSEPQFLRMCGNIFRGEKAWAADQIRKGKPPGGLHMSWLDWIGLNTTLNCVEQTLSEAEIGEGTMLYTWASSAKPLLVDLYQWTFQGLSPRSYKVSSGGDEYTVTVVPSRQGLSNNWRLDEAAPGMYEWVLEQS